jgi:hypothetical protein
MHMDSLFLLQFACFIFMLFNSCSDIAQFVQFVLGTRCLTYTVTYTDIDRHIYG